MKRENARLKERITDREQYMAQMGELTEAILDSSNLDEEKANLVHEYFGRVRESAKEGEEEIASTTDWPAREHPLAEAKREGSKRLVLVMFLMVSANDGRKWDEKLENEER